VPLVGLEPDSASVCPGAILGKSLPAGAAKSGAETGQIDPDLARLLDAWPNLPAKDKAAILAILDRVE
jgi:hypothetical protein